MKNLLIVLLLSLGFTYGQNWNYWGEFPKNSSVTSISIDGNGRIYVLTGDRMIFYSDDDGNTWTAFANVPKYYNVMEVVASKVSNRVFVRTTCCGVAYTDDLGQTWNWDNIITNNVSGFGLTIDGIDVQGNKVLVVAANFDGNNITNVIAVSNNNGQKNTFSIKTNLYSSLDFATHNFIRDIFYFSDTSIFITFHPISTSVISLERSTDNLQSVSSITAFNGFDIFDIVQMNDTIFLAANTQIHFSVDNGNSWTPFSSLPIIDNIIDLETYNNKLYALTGLGNIYVYENGNWSLIVSKKGFELIRGSSGHIFSGGKNLLGVYAISLSNFTNTISYIGGGITPSWFAAGNKLYIGAYNSPFISIADIDIPNSWSHLEMNSIIPQNFPSVSFSYDFDSAMNIIVGGINYIVKIDKNTDSVEILISPSNIPSLSQGVNNFFPNKIRISNNGILAFQKNSSAGFLFYTLDSGNTWITLIDGNNMPNRILNDFEVINDTIYGLITSITIRDSLIYSTDTGNTWNAIAIPNNSAKYIFRDKSNNLYVLSGISLYKLNRSTKQWQLLQTFGNDPNIYVELTEDSASNLFVLVANEINFNPNTDGIWKSSDGGNSWAQIPFPIKNNSPVILKNLHAYSDGLIAIATDDNPLHIKGIYYYSDKIITAIKNLNTTPIKLYPNPSREILFISGTTSDYVIIYNSLGQNIGERRISDSKINIKELPSGIYFLNIENNVFKVIKE